MGHEITHDIIYEVTLPDGRVVTSPLGFDKPEVSGDLMKLAPIQDIIYEVTLEDGTIVTGPSHFPDSRNDT